MLDLPFGYMNEEWRELVVKLLETDELWIFQKSDDERKALCGRVGIAVVRNGDVADGLITEMS